jgi:hypothetical protein
MKSKYQYAATKENYQDYFSGRVIHGATRCSRASAKRELLSFQGIRRSESFRGGEILKENPDSQSRPTNGGKDSLVFQQPLKH